MEPLIENQDKKESKGSFEFDFHVRSLGTPYYKK